MQCSIREQRAVHCISNENELLFFDFLLFHLNDQVARTAPETVGVGDAQGVETAGVLVEAIGVGGVIA